MNNRNRGERPKNITQIIERRSKETRKCLVCGAEYQYLKRFTGAKYCSPDCYHASRQQPKKKIDKPKPLRIVVSRKVEKVCAICGDTFKVFPSHVDYQKCCSTKCRHILWAASRKGAGNPNWKGGKKPKNKIVRDSDEYAEWRMEVFKRDGFTCVICQQVGGALHAHHIKPFSKYKSLRTDVNNGVTVCKVCHKKLHGKGKRWVQTIIGRAVKTQNGILQIV